MIIRICNKCNISKLFNQYHKDKRAKDGIRYTCKDCSIKLNKEYRSSHREQELERGRQYHSDNKKKRNALYKIWKDNNKDYDKQRHKEYRENNKDHCKEYNRIYRTNNKSYYKEYDREYRKSPQRKIYNKSYVPKYEKRKRKLDPIFKLKSYLRSRIATSLNGKNKSGSAVKDLGCTIEELKRYLESKFYNNPTTGETMSWKNRGKYKYNWQVDHIKELHTFDLTNREQFVIACHYTNLQPLWHEDHIKKSALNRKRDKR